MLLAVGAVLAAVTFVGYFRSAEERQQRATSGRCRAVTPQTVVPRLDTGERLEGVVVDQTRESSGRRVAYSVLIGGPALIDKLFARARRWTE